MAGIRSPTEAEDFSSSLCIQTDSGAHPASYTLDTGGSFPRGKARPGRDADHSPPSSAEVKKEQELYLLSPKVPSRCVTGPLYSFIYIYIYIYVCVCVCVCSWQGGDLEYHKYSSQWK
jgi:hypothetical protein